MLRAALSERVWRAHLAVGLAGALLLFLVTAAPATAAPASDAGLRKEFVRQATKLTNDLQRLKRDLDGQADTLLDYIDRLNPFAIARDALLRDARAAGKALQATEPASAKAKEARKQALGAASALRRSSACWGDFLDDVLVLVDHVNPFAYVRDALGGEEVVRAKASCGLEASEQATSKLAKANKLLGSPIPASKFTRAKLPPLGEDIPLASGSEVPDLAGQWLGQDGGRFTITQASGSSAVSWTACDANGGTLWSHTFSGTITGGYLVGTFVDGPPGTLRNTGTLVLAVQGTSSFSWVASATIDGKTYASFPTLTRQWSRGGHAGCPALGSDFAIASVSYPTTVVAGAPAATMTVRWEGSPVFPVTAVYAPDSCPAGVTCTTPRQTFASLANPLALAGAIGCWGSFPGPTVFDYSVYLEDATGKRTARRNADFTCLPS